MNRQIAISGSLSLFIKDSLLSYLLTSMLMRLPSVCASIPLV